MLTATIGPKFPVPWRGNTSLAWEKGPSALGFGNLTGGFMTGGDAGTVKMTAPAAFATALLAWGLLEFPKGYAKANATAHALDTLRWSNDYLLKTFTKDRKRSQRHNEYLIVYQVRGDVVENLKKKTRKKKLKKKNSKKKTQKKKRKKKTLKKKHKKKNSKKKTQKKKLKKKTSKISKQKNSLSGRQPHRRQEALDPPRGHGPQDPPQARLLRHDLQRHL